MKLRHLHKYLCPAWWYHVRRSWNFQSFTPHWFCRWCPITQFLQAGTAYRISRMGTCHLRNRTLRLTQSLNDILNFWVSTQDLTTPPIQWAEEMANMACDALDIEKTGKESEVMRSAKGTQIHGRSECVYPF